MCLEIAVNTSYINVSFLKCVVVTQQHRAPVGTQREIGTQCRNRRGGGRGSAPRDFWPGNFCWPTGKKEAREKRGKWENGEENGKMEKKRRKNVKGRWKIENGRKNSYKMRMRRGLFLFCFVCLFVCLFFAFSLFKPLKKFGGLPKWKFSTEKKAGKNQAKWFCSLSKIFLLRPWEGLMKMFLCWQCPACKSKEQKRTN